MTTLIVLTDRGILDAVDNPQFDPSSVAAFVAEAANADEPLHVTLIADWWWRGAHPLHEWAQSVGFRVFYTSSTRSERVDSWEDRFLYLLRHEYDEFVLLDPHIRSDDSRVTIHRRVTR